MKYLVSRGVPPKRLVAAGYGEFQPLEDGSSDDVMRRNRRIGYVPQQRPLPPETSLRGRDLVTLGVDGHRFGLPLPTNRDEVAAAARSIHDEHDPIRLLPAAPLMHGTSAIASSGSSAGCRRSTVRASPLISSSS